MGVEDGPKYDKIHASAFEVLQDIIFGLQPVLGIASNQMDVIIPSSKLQCTSARH